MEAQSNRPWEMRSTSARPAVRDRDASSIMRGSGWQASTLSLQVIPILVLVTHSLSKVLKGDWRQPSGSSPTQLKPKAGIPTDPQAVEISSA